MHIAKLTRQLHGSRAEHGSRLIDQMGEAGILGPHKGNGIQRDVLITIDDWHRMQQLEAEGDDRTDEEIEADRKLAAKVDQESDAFQDAFHDEAEEIGRAHV